MRIISVLVAALLLPIGADRSLAETPPTEAWVHTWNGPASQDDHGLLAAFEPAGRLYVAGTTYEGGVDGHREDFFLTRFDAAGNDLWTRQYGGSGYDAPGGLLVTLAGDVVVTGYAWADTQNTVTTLCYDDAGTLLWNRAVPVMDTFWNGFAPRVVEDLDGNLFVCARSNDDYLVAKLSPVGDLVWTRSYDGPDAGVDDPADLAVDAAGSVYVTGIAEDVGLARAFATVKFDAAGTFQWDQFESGDFGSVFEYAGVAVAPDGDVVVVGNPESTCGVFQVRTWKLAAATGAVQWLEVFPPEPCDSIEPVDMAVDGLGNVVVAGFGLVGGADFHFQTLRYAADGQFHWHREFDGVGTSSDVASSLVLDAAGNAYVAGLTTFPPQNRDFTAVKYTPAGDEAWSVHWAGPSGTNDGAEGIAVSTVGDVALTGHAYTPGSQEDAITILYRQEDITAVSPMAAGADLSVRAALNPFAHQTSVRYRVGRAQPVRLSVFDVRGRRVRMLRDGFAASGDHEVAWRGEDDRGRALPSGTYLVRLESGSGMASVRVGLVR